MNNYNQKIKYNIIKQKVINWVIIIHLQQIRENLKNCKQILRILKKLKNNIQRKKLIKKCNK